LNGPFRYPLAPAWAGQVENILAPLTTRYQGHPSNLALSWASEWT